MTKQERLKIVREMFKLEVNEEFNIIYKGEEMLDIAFHFTKNDLIDCDGDSANSKIGWLITGVYTIEKLPQKPKVGDDVWVIDPLSKKGYDHTDNYTVYGMDILYTDFLDSRGVKHFKTKEEVIKEIEKLGWKV